MRPIYLVLLCLIAAPLLPSASAQQLRRENAVRPRIGDQLARIESMTGWSYSDDRRWVSAPNKIPHRDSHLRRLGGSFAIGIENIRFISLRPIELDGRDVALIVIGRNDGGFEYPAIYEGWFTYTTWYWYAVEWPSVAALLPEDVTLNRAYTVGMETIACGFSRDLHNPLTLPTIADDIVASTGSADLCQRSRKLHARVFPVELDGQRHVRFVFFEGDGLMQLWNHFGTPLPFEMSETQPEAFDSYYYEVPIHTFNAFVDPARERAPTSQASHQPEPTTSPSFSTGSSGLSIEGLGSRGASCSAPGYPGVSGTVTYAVTFAPDGRYVASRPLRRDGDARIDRAVQSIIRTCRAQALPEAASQVNQEGRITFRFTN